MRVHRVRATGVSSRARHQVHQVAVGRRGDGVPGHNGARSERHTLCEVTGSCRRGDGAHVKVHVGLEEVFTISSKGTPPGIKATGRVSSHRRKQHRCWVSSQELDTQAEKCAACERERIRSMIRSHRACGFRAKRQDHGQDKQTMHMDISRAFSAPAWLRSSARSQQPS